MAASNDDLKQTLNTDYYFKPDDLFLLFTPYQSSKHLIHEMQKNKKKGDRELREELKEMRAKMAAEKGKKKPE